MNTTNPLPSLKMNVEVCEQPLARQTWPYFCLLILILGIVFSAITPPFQAPDEFDHVKRTYMLTHGQIMLRSPDGEPSGGEVDTALLNYMEHFVPIMGKANEKMSTDQLAAAGAIRWSHERTFTSPTGTAYYFPALYLPQAIGLSTGRALGLTVGQSYKLARLATLLACVALLATAFTLYPPPPGVLAILLLPMNLFLYSSAVLDAMATSASVLAISAFLCLATRTPRHTKAASILLVASVVAVTACRANMLPMLLLPFAGWYVLKSRRMLVGAIVAALFVLGWTLLTVKLTVYPPGPRAIDHSARLFSYLFDPLGFGTILWNTVSDPALRSFYMHSFIGVLGWLDAPLPSRVYPVLGLLVLATIALTLTLRTFTWHRGVLVLIVAGAILLTFLALLVQWTIGPAEKVDGVQGRYFAIPAIMLVYALTANPAPRRTLAHLAATCLVAILAAISGYATTVTLVARYHTATQQKLEPASRIAVSPPLTSSRIIPLHFDHSIATAPGGLSEVQVMIGTYRASHPGTAKLVLWTAAGEMREHEFELASLVDNEYARFAVQSDNYVAGSIQSVDGEGISVYQSAFGPAILSCLKGVTNDGGAIATPGCP